MKTTIENTVPETAPLAPLAFSPKDVKAAYAALISDLAALDAIKLGKDAKCGKSDFLTIYCYMLAKMAVIPKESVSSAFAVLDALPANASAMRQELERWNEDGSAAKKGNNLAEKYISVL